jgi:hypothetical protein
MSVCRLTLAVLALGTLPALEAGCRRRHVPPSERVELVSAVAPEEPVAAAPAVPAAPKWDPAPPPPAVPAPSLGTVRRTIADGDGGTVNGDPKGPRAEALNQVVGAAMPALQRCLDGAAELPEGKDLTLTVKYAIEPTGKTSGVAVTGPVPATARACAEGVMAGLRFPEFGGPPVEGSFPFSYRRDVR